MNRARRTAMSVAVIIALAAIVTPPFAGALSGDDSPLLFVIKGKGTVTGDTLRVTTSTVEWFTDRPERRAGTMSTMEFRERWSEYGFEDVAPNAAIAGRDIDAVVELTEQPKMKSSRMSFATSYVRGELPRGPLGEVSVFIDATVTGTPVCTNGFGTDIEILTMAPPPSNMVVPCKNTVGVAAFATGQTPTDSTVLAHGAARIDGLEVILILAREQPVVVRDPRRIARRLRDGRAERLDVLHLPAGVGDHGLGRGPIPPPSEQFLPDRSEAHRRLTLSAKAEEDSRWRGLSSEFGGITMAKAAEKGLVRAIARRSLARTVLVGCLVVGALVLVPAGTASAAPAPVPTPAVESTPDGTIFNQAAVDFAASGFTEEEFFFSGDTAFGGYKSRMIVRRPSDPNRFNGTVIVEWLNATTGYDVDVDFLSVWPLMQENGFAWVGVTTQQLTVDFLAGWDPPRYGSLHMTEGGAAQPAAFEVFSQAGMALRNNGTGVDPLGGLQAERLIAIGQSQSSSRLTTYVNTIHDIALEPVFDAYLLHGGGSAPSRAPVPVIKLNSESEAAGYFGQRGVSHPLYRYWEVAGTAHVPLEGHAYILGLVTLVRGFSVVCPFPHQGIGGPVPTDPVVRAAVAHLDRWVQTGTPAPEAPLIDMVPSPSNPNVGVIQRDQYGNATGGIRLPQQEAPTGRNTPSTACLIEVPGIGTILVATFPQWDAFDGGNDPAVDPADAVNATEPASAKAVYGNHGQYVSAFRAATNAVEDAGFILSFDAQQLNKDAASSDIAK